MIRHILFITFTDCVLPEKILTVRTAFLQIPDQIEGITGVEWGVNDSPEGKNAGFTHCVLMTFADEAARQRYLRILHMMILKRYFDRFCRISSYWIIL